jgi:hypothetical protein
LRLSGKPTLTVTPASSGVAMFTLASLSQSIDCCNPTPPVGSVFCNLGGGSVCVVAGQIAAAKSLPEYRQAQLEQRQCIEKATRAPVHAGFQCVVAHHLGAEKPVSLVMAIPDHPWD